MLLVAFVVMQVNMELPMPDPPVSSSSVFAATLELYITGKNITRACVLKGGCAWGGVWTCFILNMTPKNRIATCYEFCAIHAHGCFFASMHTAKTILNKT